MSSESEEGKPKKKPSTKLKGPDAEVRAGRAATKPAAIDISSDDAEDEDFNLAKVEKLKGRGPYQCLVCRGHSTDYMEKATCVDHVHKHHGWPAARDRNGYHYRYSDYWTQGFAEMALGKSSSHTLTKKQFVEGFKAFKDGDINTGDCVRGMLEAHSALGKI